jgi:hypothetical protein
MEQFNYTLYIYDFEFQRFIIRYQANTLKLIQKEINEMIKDNLFIQTPRFKVNEMIFKVLRNEN